MRVIGISPMHDSSVAIVHNGNLEYFCKEERLTRKKRDHYPFLSLEKAFKETKGRIDYAVISSPVKTDPFNDYLESYLNKKLNKQVIRLCDHHHLTHASLCFYNSGFNEALSIIIDRNGSYYERIRESETIFNCYYPNTFETLYKSFWLDKIGVNEDVNNFEKVKQVCKGFDCDILAESTMNITKVYETATVLIGEHPLENGKTMGLAAYGKKSKQNNLFINGIPNTNLFITNNDSNQTVLQKSHTNKLTKNLRKSNYKFYADYAYHVQKQTQEQVLQLVKKYVDKTKQTNVCISGGYGLNVVTNEYLVKMLPKVNFYFEPLADDSGNSIGAAMYVYRQLTNDTKINKLQNTFFNDVSHKISVNGKKTNTDEVARLLKKQKIVAVFNEKAEGGPRALGNRSILFDPTNKNAKDIVNRVKKREWYRPFAASILKENFTEFFETHGLKESKFMTISFQSKTSKIPGVVHVDNSCRVQTVTKDIPHLYNLLKDFEKYKNVPVLLNTSFNMAGEALVETVEDAILTFKNTEIDILWFPETNEILTKEDL